jgi:hypothetical protein
MLAERVVGLSWRLQRAERLQNAAFAALDEGEPTPLLDARLEEWKQLKENEWERGLAGVVDEDVALGKVVVADFGGARVLDRLLMYERRIESSLYRTMAQLRQERQARTAAVEAEEVSRSEGDLAAGQEPVAPVELASFGADAVAEGGAEEVSSSQCQVSSGEEASSTKCPVSGGGSDFTLQTSHFKPAMITPDGVTTNEEVGRGRPTYEESSCKTKPMSPASAGGQVPCGEKVMEDSSRNESGKTNPIPGARTACPPSEGRFRCDEVPSQPAVGCLGFPMDGFHPS